MRTTHKHDGSPLRECLTCNNTARHGSEFCGRCEAVNTARSEAVSREEHRQYALGNLRKYINDCTTISEVNYILDRIVDFLDEHTTRS